MGLCTSKQRSKISLDHENHLKLAQLPSLCEKLRDVAFEKYDDNGDGVISVSELKNFVKCEFSRVPTNLRDIFKE